MIQQHTNPESISPLTSPLVRPAMTVSNRQGGFTLIEMLVTITLMSIALTVAIPSYKSMIANNRSAVEVNRFLASINIARSEAVKRGVPIGLCARKLPRTLPESCSGSNDWSTGWILFTDKSGTAGVMDGSDALLYAWGAPDGNPTVSASAPSIQYLSTGDMRSAASFSYFFPGCKGDEKRVITISMTGRAAINTYACS